MVGVFKINTFMSSCEAVVVKKAFLDISEAAGIAGCSVKRLRTLVQNERISVVQIGQKFFILKADFEQIGRAHV